VPLSRSGIGTIARVASIVVSLRPCLDAKVSGTTAASPLVADGRTCFHTAVIKGVHWPLFLFVRPLRRNP
jgi:hypothetical protein